MQAAEFAKPSQVSGAKEYALALSIAADDLESFQEQGGRLKQAVVGWASRRGAAAGALMVTIVGDVKGHGAIEALFARIHGEERDLAPLLGRMEVRLILADATGRPRRERLFARGT